MYLAILRDHRLQRLHTESDIRGGVGILPAERFDDSLADHSAIFIICLRQHHDQLRLTAPGNHIAQPQIPHGNILEIFHGAIQASAGQGFIVPTMQ